MDPTIRLRIANRIHFALLRHYSEDVAVITLLRDAAHAREALWVCEASGIAELVALGKQFETATRQEARAARLRGQQPNTTAPHANTPQDLEWSRDTSGFGLSRPPELPDAQVAFKPGNWLKPSSWLSRGTAR